jgi:peptide methionine sulfoxide reductase msrA/msrB
LWGVQYQFDKVKGVVQTTGGFMSGGKQAAAPDCREGGDNAGTAMASYVKVPRRETVQIVYSPQQVAYEDLLKVFFEIHNFEQADGQGPDIGEQYRSVIFYKNNREKAAAQKFISHLTQEGFTVATLLAKAAAFSPADEYHQHYYQKTGGRPYCHIWKKLNWPF